MSQGPSPPASGPVILERLMELERKFDSFLEEWQGYTAAARTERHELRLFLRDDVRGLLVQLAELGRKNRKLLVDLEGALALHLGDPGQEEGQQPLRLDDVERQERPPPREQNGTRHRKAS